MSGLLSSLYGYHSWANQALLDKLEALDPVARADELESALGLIDHYNVVARIFAAHLANTAHPFISDRSVRTPTLPELRETVTATDRWYVDYVETVSHHRLSEALAFTFTDGDEACMTRQEMLMHVALHAAIHRGEACRILSQIGVTPPWDTYAVYLHQAEPARRLKSA